MDALALMLVGPGCSRFREFDFGHGARLTGGDPDLGRKKFAAAFVRFLPRHSPGVPKADGTIAASLEHWSWRRTFLDKYPNTPANLEKWLENPSCLKPGTSMPDMDVSPQNSRDMAAYLFSIN